MSIIGLSDRRLWQPPRRKFISLSDALNTGMHSRNPITHPTSNFTVSFWWKGVGTQNGKTLWASPTGHQQVYTSGTNMRVRHLNQRSVQLSATTNVWAHLHWNVGYEHDGSVDVRGFKNGVEIGTDSSASVSSELPGTGSHWFFGDDNPGQPNTDDGIKGQCFDFLMFDGIHPPDKCNHQHNIRWKDIDESVKPYLMYRLDGQHSDPGHDSSGNENHFVVENKGVTLSSFDLPPGANELPISWAPFAPSVGGPPPDITPRFSGLILSGGF